MQVTPRPCWSLKSIIATRNIVSDALSGKHCWDLIPVECHFYLDVRMDAFHNGAGIGDAFQYQFLLFVRLEVGGPFNAEIDAADPAAVGLHDLPDGYFHSKCI